MSFWCADEKIGPESLNSQSQLVTVNDRARVPMEALWFQSLSSEACGWSRLSFASCDTAQLPASRQKCPWSSEQEVIILCDSDTAFSAGLGPLSASLLLLGYKLISSNALEAAYRWALCHLCAFHANYDHSCNSAIELIDKDVTHMTKNRNVVIFIRWADVESRWKASPNIPQSSLW